MRELWLAVGVAWLLNAWGCGSCGKERLGETRRECRLNVGQAYHQAPNLAGRKVAPVAAGRHLDLRVHLPLRNTADLDGLLGELYDPNSDAYGKFLTPEEFAARFHPTAAHLAAMRAHLERHGLAVDPVAHGAVLGARGRVAQVERAFGTTLHHFKGHGDTLMRAPDGPLTAEGAPHVRAVRGIASTPRHLTRATKPRSALTGGLTAADIRRGYSLPDTLDGNGEVIGFIEMDGYLDADLDAYALANSLRRVPTRRVLIGGYDGRVQDQDAQVEVTMDIQLANALAPAAAEFRVYSAKNAGTGFIDALNEAANPSIGDKLLVKYISCSWGVPEDQMSAADIEAEHDVLRQMAAQGQVFTVASGDSGSLDDGLHVGTDDPAAQPWATATGGTTLSLTHARARGSETAWSGSGGGVSCFWPAPSWQTLKLGVPALDDWRNVPDVAMHADPAGPSGSYSVIVNGQPMSVGGTSCAAPLWAAIAGGIGSQRRALGRGSLGALAPHLYRLGALGGGNTVFNQITQGNNGVYYATPDKAYDNICGWGTPRGNAFVSALTNL